MTDTTRPTTLLTVLLLAASLPFGLAACSSSDTTETASDTTAGIGAKWGSCMRDAGFDLTDPDDDEVTSGIVRMPTGADEHRFTTAAADCKQQLGIESTDSNAAEEWARKYDAVASCIREHGYDDFPEQRHGSLSWDADSYPRSEEPQFQGVVDDCTDEHAPGQQTKNVG